MAFLKKIVDNWKNKDGKYVDEDVEMNQRGFVVNVQAARPDDKAGPDYPDSNQAPAWVHPTTGNQQQQRPKSMQQRPKSSLSKNTKKQNNDPTKPYGPDTRELAPGIYVPGEPKKKKKKKRKLKPKKALEKVYRKTSKGLTPPSYFCSAFTCMCGFICFVSGLCMLIMGTTIPTFMVKTPAGNFMRVGGGMFTIIGFIMMLTGFFYFLLVYLRHKGMIDTSKELPDKSKQKIVDDNDDEDDDDGEYDDDDDESEKEANVNEQNVANDTRAQKVSTASSDQGIVFTARQDSHGSIQSMPANTTILAIPPSPSNRLTQRRQSVAIGQGISLGGHTADESSTDPLGRPEQIIIRNQSASNLQTYSASEANKSPRDAVPFHGLVPKSHPVPAARRGSIAIDNRPKLEKLEEIVSDTPPSESNRLTSRRASLFMASSSPMEGVDNQDSIEGSRLTSRRASLFQVSDPMAPGSLSTPKVLKKTKSSLDFDFGSSLAGTPQTPMSARRPGNDTPSDVLFRTSSFNKYSRNK